MKPFLISIAISLVSLQTLAQQKVTSESAQTKSDTQQTSKPAEKEKVNCSHFFVIRHSACV
jgi:hypothetical protein